MARVLFVVPPLPERSYPGKFMGPDYLAGALVVNGHSVEILDLDIVAGRERERARTGGPAPDPLKFFAKKLADFGPQVVGITNLSMQNDIANYLAWFAKKRNPDALVVKGGAHETAGGWKYTMELHHDYVDASVAGDAEEAIVQIARAVDDGAWDTRKASIPQVAYWDGVKAVINPWKPSRTACRTLLPRRLHYYPEYNFEVLRERKTAQMMTVRGCGHRCAFCSEAFLHPRLCYRALHSLAQEMDSLRAAGYGEIYFDDSTFTLRPSWALTVAKLAHRKGFIWGCNTRVDRLSERLVKQLAANGCEYMFCGVESLVPETLLAMRKTKDPTHYLECVPRVYHWMREVGISPSVFLIFGNARRERDGSVGPERWDDIETTIVRSLELDAAYLSMNILRLLPGVPYSCDPDYAAIRPTGDGQVHAGHYDILWYMAGGAEDLRSRHPIYRAFEGSRSVHARHVSPEYAYRILEFATHVVNEHNLDSSRQVRIVVDEGAANFFRMRHRAGRRFYELAPFDEIPAEVEPEPLTEEWRKVLRQR